MRALIVGASGELGGAIARRLVRGGHELILHAHNNMARLNELADEIGVKCLCSGDVKNEADVAAFIGDAEQDGGFDALVYCAGTNPTAAIVQETTYHDWVETIAINLTGAFLCLKEAIPILRRRPAGSVVIVSSIFGLSSPANRGAYGASKHGLTGLVQSAAREEADKVRINAICPGPMWTENVRNIFARHAKSVGISVEEYVKQRQAQIPARRFLELDECAALVEFLISPQARFLTGETIRIAGGEG